MSQSYTATESALSRGHRIEGAGQPDGWMTRSGYAVFMALIGSLVPLLIIGLTYITRFFPDYLINLPHKAYWLAPPRRDAVFNYLLNHSFWLGTLTLLLMSCTHWLTVQANQTVPVRLNTSLLLPIMGLFSVGVILWAITLVRHFRHPA
ncbi:MAG TPA: hypothetical protein VN673_03475 [Clostridia bacterium]|nr:hypothetical protein [Clostridia bacterium]